MKRELIENKIFMLVMFLTTGSAFGASLDRTLTNSVSKVQAVGAAILVLSVIIAGVKYVVSPQESKESAKNIVLGGLCIFSATQIVDFLKSALKG